MSLPQGGGGVVRYPRYCPYIYCPYLLSEGGCQMRQGQCHYNRSFFFEGFPQVKFTKFQHSFERILSISFKGSLQKKNYDYSDIVPISTDTHPPKGDRDSKYRDNIVDIPLVVGTYKPKIIWSKYAKIYKLQADYSKEFRFRGPPSRVVCPYNFQLFSRDFD